MAHACSPIYLCVLSYFSSGGILLCYICIIRDIETSVLPGYKKYGVRQSRRKSILFFTDDCCTNFFDLNFSLTAIILTLTLLLVVLYLRFTDLIIPGLSHIEYISRFKVIFCSVINLLYTMLVLSMIQVHIEEIIILFYYSAKGDKKGELIPVYKIQEFVCLDVCLCKHAHLDFID